MTAQVQLSKIAVVYKFDLTEKKKSISLCADPGASLPWQAFLTPSVPNNALKLLGASTLATWQLVGPISYLHFLMQSSAINSIPTIKSDEIKLVNS